MHLFHSMPIELSLSFGCSPNLPYTEKIKCSSSLLIAENQQPSFQSFPLEQSYAMQEPFDSCKALRPAPLTDPKEETYQVEEEQQRSESLGLDGKSTDFEAEDCAQDEEEQRRIRR